MLSRHTNIRASAKGLPIAMKCRRFQEHLNGVSTKVQSPPLLPPPLHPFLFSVTMISQLNSKQNMQRKDIDRS
uniref:Uncharacterized protein n=1 Tax=Cucumis melo TaxID=3656 RepID=A0A9I9E4I1_CUCME